MAGRARRRAQIRIAAMDDLVVLAPLLGLATRTEQLANSPMYQPSTVFRS